MKKTLGILALATILVVGCSSTESKADGENATYLESVDEYNTFTAIKMVDKETGCKYMVVTGNGTHRPNVTQMLGKDGQPVCE